MQCYDILGYDWSVRVSVGHRLILMFRKLCIPTDVVRVYDGPVAMILIEEYKFVCKGGNFKVTEYFTAQIQHHYSGNRTVDRALLFFYSRERLQAERVALHGRYNSFSVVHNNKGYFQKMFTFSKPDVNGFDHQVYVNAIDIEKHYIIK